MSGCECGKEESPASLALCLAPPPGDYETTIPMTRNQSLVINSNGMFIRTVAVDDTLPFAKTIVRPAPPEVLDNIALRVTWDDILCQTVRDLLGAAESGSLTAREKVERCHDLIEEILRKCKS